MSCNYADGLSPYHDKGQLGLQERFDTESVIATKVNLLAKWMYKAKHVVLHTGAGISTSAGIPDFRGPRGVWTLQAKGQKPDLSKDFNDTIPTATHMAIARLVESGKVKYVVSQNIDGLHLRSGLPRKYLSELHGNMFIEQCNTCRRQFVRNKAVPTVGQKSLNKACPTIKATGRACRGRLHDTILDWEHSLPENDLAMADFHSCMADLSIAIGTTMQIVPSGSLPLYTKRAGGKLVIINLQPTKHDTKADLLISGYADDVMAKLMKQLSLRIPKYMPSNDPTKLALSSDRYFDWTITDATTAQMRKLYEAKCGPDAQKRLEVIDEDDIPLTTRVERVVAAKKKKLDEGISARKNANDDCDSDLEVVEEIPRKPRGRPKKNSSSVVQVQSPTKLTIKKTQNQPQYEIVKTRTSRADVEIIRQNKRDSTTDLEMLCESDGEGPMVFTTNFRRYLQQHDKTFKREDGIQPNADNKDDMDKEHFFEDGTKKDESGEVNEIVRLIFESILDVMFGIEDPTTMEGKMEGCDGERAGIINEDSGKAETVPGDEAKPPEDFKAASSCEAAKTLGENKDLNESDMNSEQPGESRGESVERRVSQNEEVDPRNDGNNNRANENGNRDEAMEESLLRNVSEQHLNDPQQEPTPQESMEVESDDHPGAIESSSELDLSCQGVGSTQPADMQMHLMDSTGPTESAVEIPTADNTISDIDLLSAVLN